MDSRILYVSKDSNQLEEEESMNFNSMTPAVSVVTTLLLFGEKVKASKVIAASRNVSLKTSVSVMTRAKYVLNLHYSQMMKDHEIPEDPVLWTIMLARVAHGMNEILVLSEERQDEERCPEQ